MFNKKYPFFHQSHSSDCGITCLRMITKFYGKNIKHRRFKQLAEIESVGASMLNLIKVSERVGFNSFGISLETVDDCIDIASYYPCVVFWNRNHYVTLYGFEKGKFIIGDPAKGILKISKEEFYTHAFKNNSTEESPKAFIAILEPTQVFHDQKDDESIRSEQIKFAKDKLSNFKIFFLVIFGGLMVTASLQYVLPFITKSVVDLGIKSGDLDFVKYLLIGQLIIVLSKIFFEILRSWMVLHLSIRINFSLISTFLNKLFRLPLPFFENKKIGDILQRIKDHQRIEHFVTRTILTTLIAVVTLVVYSFILYSFSPLFFMLFAAGSLLYIGWTTVFLNARRDIDWERFELLSKNQSILIQIIGGVHDLRITDSEKFYYKKWDENQHKYFRNDYKLLRVNQIQSTGMQLIIEIIQIMILFLCARLIVQNQITLGTMISIQFIVGQLIAPMGDIEQSIIFGQKAKISFDRIFEFWSEKDEVELRPEKNTLLPKNLDQAVEFKDVTFKHIGQEKNPALKNINFDIPNGKITAIVGASGSGKTTLLKLLLGYYHNYEGDIMMGNQNFKDINLTDWRKRCGVILQESYIFNDTIIKNITLADEIDEAKFQSAVNIANITEYIEQLPMKENTVIGRDGKGLSMGQKQRILIARAIYNDPDYIFMDEATNSLDAENEDVIMSNLKTFFKGKTVIIIAHRLNTIQFADKIAVFNNGRIMEQGSHTELLESKGQYYQLIKKQMQNAVV